MSFRSETKGRGCCRERGCLGSGVRETLSEGVPSWEDGGGREGMQRTLDLEDNLRSTYPARGSQLMSFFVCKMVMKTHVQLQMDIYKSQRREFLNWTALYNERWLVFDPVA